MSIIIVGAGEVGYNVARRLSREREDIVVIDKDEEKIKRVSETLDVHAIHGSGSSMEVLRKAGIEKAEIIVAATNSDEVNMVSCLVAGVQAIVPVKIARIKDSEYASNMLILGEDRLDIDLDQYLWMIRHKTAALLAAAAQMGAIVATDDTEQLSRYYRFGESLGMAFQIQDDILGTWGDEKATGKSAATDIRDKKKTLLVVYTLDQTRDRRAAQRLTDLYAQPGPLDESAIQHVQALFEDVGAHQYAEEAAEEYYRAALQNLKQTGIDNKAQSHLRELAASLLGRQS